MTDAHAGGTASADPGTGQAARSHVIWGSASCTRGMSSDGRTTIVLQDSTSSRSSSTGKQGESSDSAKTGSSAKTDPHDDDGEKGMGALELLAEGGFWSVGSEKHFAGLCRPCQWVITSAGCRSGQDCTFCHLPHNTSPSDKNSRPCKAQREYSKKVLKSLGKAAGDFDAAELNMMVKGVTCQSNYTKAIAHRYTNAGKSRVRHQDQGVQPQSSKSTSAASSDVINRSNVAGSDSVASEKTKLPRRRNLVSL